MDAWFGHCSYQSRAATVVQGLMQPVLRSVHPLCSVQPLLSVHHGLMQPFFDAAIPLPLLHRSAHAYLMPVDV